MKKALLRLFFLCGILLGFLGVVGAQSSFDAQKGYEWLVSQCQNGNCDGDLIATAFYTLAMKDAGQVDYAEEGLDYIKSRKANNEACWPSGSCKVKETAFALWVLKEFGEDVDAGDRWLNDALSAAPSLQDFWFLEVVTSNNGTCKISYALGNNDTIQRDVSVNAGRFPDCPGAVNTFFNLNTCLQNNLLNNNPALELDINCNQLGPSTILSVIFNTASLYYVIEEAETSRKVITIQNGCLGTTKNSACNYDTSLFSNWLLSAIGSDTTVLLYVKNNADELKAVDNSLLYLSASQALRQKYLDNLIGLQRNDGSFNKQVFETAIATLALRQSGQGQALTSAVDWLKSKQRPDGSWDNSELKTAATLYAAFTSEAISLPPIGSAGPGKSPGPSSEPGFCGDGTCDPDENSVSCASDCPSSVCVVNGICETYANEDSSNCQQDCTCGDGICDDAESTASCTEDCGEPTTQQPAVCGNGVLEGAEECDIDTATGFGDDSACPGKCTASCSCGEKKKGFPWWITIVLAIAVVVAIVMYMRFKGSPGGKRKPSGFSFGADIKMPKMPASRTQVRYPQQQQSQKSSKVEDELDKSIEEAKKLLGKM